MLTIIAWHHDEDYDDDDEDDDGNDDGGVESSYDKDEGEVMTMLTSGA